MIISDEIFEEFNAECVFTRFLEPIISIKNQSFASMDLNGTKPLAAKIKLFTIA